MTTVEATTELPGYGPGQRVRWKQAGRWRYGHLGAVVHERDGSLRVYEETTGAARALRASDLQRRVRGPRGGGRWEPCESVQPPSPDAGMVARRRAWHDVAGLGRTGATP